MNVLENHLLEIKGCLKAIVEKSGVMNAECQLDIVKYPVDYLTFVELQNKEYPWVLSFSQESTKAP